MGNVVADPTNDSPFYVPEFQIQGLSAEFQNWDRMRAAGKFGWKFSFSKDKANYNQQSSSTSASASLGLRLPFFNLPQASGNAQVAQQELNTLFEKTTITIEFAGFKNFPVVLGKWYNRDLVDRYRDQVKASRGGNDIFGFNGTFAAAPVEVVLAYYSKTTLDFGSEAKSVFDRSLSAGGGMSFSYGPFSFGGNAQHQESQHDYSWNQQGSSISIEDTSPQPILIGMIGSVFDKQQLATWKTKYNQLVGSSGAHAFESGAGGASTSTNKGVTIRDFVVFDGDVSLKFTPNSVTVQKSDSADFAGVIEFGDTSKNH